MSNGQQPLYLSRVYFAQLTQIGFRNYLSICRMFVLVLNGIRGLDGSYMMNNLGSFVHSLLFCQTGQFSTTVSFRQPWSLRQQFAPPRVAMSDSELLYTRNPRFRHQQHYPRTRPSSTAVAPRIFPNTN